ncbi:hypothetical protein IMZ48_27590 [Candidatus Bathyarchaeota archaeon]|nr:hypothetical protein [Candidatus Bathyarchaeota archaeon]
MLTVCISQAWKEGRLDVPEHMLRKAGYPFPNLDPGLAENLADTFFDIGREFLSKREFQMAVKWLERAYEVTDGQDIEKLSRDGVELRLTILQAYIQALVGTKTLDNLKKAEDYVAFIETEIGDRPVLLLLRLELLQSAPDEEFDSLAYESVLHRMVKNFNFTEEHFKFMLHHARWLYDRSATLGCSVMDDLIATKILPSEKGEWIEKALVLRVFMTTGQSSILENCIELGDLLSKAKESLGEPIQAAAAAAAQSVSWAPGYWEMDVNLMCGSCCGSKSRRP